MIFFLNIFQKKSRSKSDGIFYKKLSNLLDFKPKETEHYKRAFTHRSVNKIDTAGNPLNYERLEFLGDAILGSIIASHLFITSANGDEGYLTKMRSKIVSRENLNQVSKELNLIELLDCKINKNQFSENIYGNILEALIGAIYLDKGYESCSVFIHAKILKNLEDLNKLEGKITSYKSLFIEYCQKEKKTFRFDSYEDEGREHIKYFAVKLYFENNIIAKGRATSKKKAEEKAAQRAYFALQDNIQSNIK